MAFRFNLAPLLRLRQSLERQRVLRVQELNLQLSHTRASLAQLDRFLDDSDQKHATQLSAGCTAAELQFTSNLRDNLLRYREGIQSEVRELEALREQAVIEYQQASCEREVLQTLRARQRTAYDRQQARHQQQELDAAHLLQRWHVGRKT